jgi:deazaflavin-dependent oxidoreductase (nitroreductase family)
MKPAATTKRERLLNWIRYFNKRYFNRLTLYLTRRGRGPFSIITHTGRKSGNTYNTPVLATFLGDDIFIPLSYGNQVDWLKNVLVEGGCILQKRDTFLTLVQPRVIPKEAAMEKLPPNRRRLFQHADLKEFVWMRVIPDQTG